MKERFRGETMKKVALIIVVALVLIGLAACGSNKAAPKPDGSMVYFPKWWDKQGDSEYVNTYGMATKASVTMSQEAARANALAEAARFVEAEVKSMLKNYEEEAGVHDPQVLALTQNVIKVVANTTFRGAIKGESEVRLEQTPNGPRYTTYLQMKIPRQDVNKQVNASIRNEEALYNQFKASQAFQELDRQF